MPETLHFDVTVVGSGFAGSVLARILSRLGCSVVLVERSRHPRFALGESSTPLAGFCLERLAGRYDLPDLHDLAAYGRWRRTHPELRRGLKRGFTFYHHRPGEEFEPGAGNGRRLLVAASPEDELADSHWLRSDVDRFLAERAVAAGVRLLENAEVVAVEVGKKGFSLELRDPRGEDAGRRIRSRFVIDATGPRGAVAEALGAGRRRPPARFSSSLVFGHFAGVGAFDPDGVCEPGPYPDEKAAVHHLLAEGWAYVLPFDHDCVSAGLVLDREGEASVVDGSPEEVWHRVLERYPSLARQFASARPLFPLAAQPVIEHRRRRAAGAAGADGSGAWAVLPHAYAFFDPMFSTGIAWSLLGVERIARAFEALGQDPKGRETARRLARYDRLLGLEADQVERLLWGARLARRDPRLFVAQSFLYFATVSFDELRQRLFEADSEAAVDRGFLGAGEPGRESLFEEAVSRLTGLATTRGPAHEALTAGFERWIASSIGPCNLVGLADPERRNLYPVDLELLVRRAGLVGLRAEELERLLPRLRGGGEALTDSPTDVP